MNIITSPRVLKVKALLFVVLGLFAGGLVLAPHFSWRDLGLLAITVWAFCRAYYFCFYVLEHYADPSFRYAGLWSALRHVLWSRRRS